MVPVSSEDWNAQVSLLTGMAAAQIMIGAKVGILRTMAPPDPGTMDRFRRQAAALGIAWPAGMAYGDFLRTLDRNDPKHLALIHEATSLFRGAGYTPFSGDLPAQPLHGAVAAPYSHVTAPLRRLVDRFGLALCAAITAGQPVPGWVSEALPLLPALMHAGDQKAAAVERACTDAVEAAVLHGHVGQTYSGVVVDAPPRGDGIVQLTDPAIMARATGAARVGEKVTVRLTGADLAAGMVGFEIVATPGA